MARYVAAPLLSYRLSTALLLASACSAKEQPSPMTALPRVEPPMVPSAPMISSPVAAAGSAAPVPEAPPMTAGVMATPMGGVAGQAMQEEAGAMAPKPPPYRPDIVFNMSGTIEAGAEAMFCMYGQMP